MINEKEKVNDILDNINGYKLDENQKKAIMSNEKNTLIIAGAGTGKTLTLLGKIRYLIEINHIREEEILCISFTNASTSSLKNKIKEQFNYNIDVLTFHKLALKILKGNSLNYRIVENDYLQFIINEYLYGYVLEDKRLIKYIYTLLEIKGKTKNYKDIITKYDNKLNQLKKTIESFINLYKENFCDTNQFKSLFETNNLKYIFKTKKKNFALLIISFSIYVIYQSELHSELKIDFNDMINLSIQIIKKNGINEKYKYILIDEYQDISYKRYELIKTIIDILNCKLVCVGDDFQSIYKFAGSKLEIFTDFEKYFGSTYIVKLNNAYRNCQELLNISTKFITKNNSQIKKNLLSNRSITNPVIIVFSNNFKESFSNLINQIYNETQKPILIISRNNFDIFNYIDSRFKLEANGILIYKKNLKIKLKFLTAHKSKGLEEENVIIINCINSIYGFPSKKKKETIFKLISNDKENFKYEEERRLFYVALTRTKNKVYIITNKNNKSIFIKELIKDNKNKITFIK